MLILRNIKLNVMCNDEEIKSTLLKKLKTTEDNLKSYKIHKRSLDARKKPDLYYNYNFVVEVENEKKILNKGINGLEKYQGYKYKYENISSKKKVCVVGYGPAGIFTAYALAKSGIEVDVYERGSNVDERKEEVENFFTTGELNPNSNVQFGEGGAGTFSDGKLTSRSKDKRQNEIFRLLVEFGAPKEILYVHNPHIGTDILSKVIKNIRLKSVENGMKINFNTKVDGLIIKGNKCDGVVINGEPIKYDYTILAIGHSARDTFEMLYKAGLDMKAKPTAVGFRIEHLQEDINIAQYGNNDIAKVVGPGEYKLTNKYNDRSIYSFCMCPGGIVVPSQSEEKTIVVNGMSYHARDKINANSAVVCSITPDDFDDNPLSIMRFQQVIEQKTYSITSSYKAPVQRVVDYLNNIKSESIGKVKPSYRLGYSLENLNNIYPDFINKAIKESLKKFNNKIKGFTSEDAILTGVETRTSSPVQVIRDRETLFSNIEKLMSIGEGSGFAGGIVSSSIEGLKAYESICNKLKN